MWTLMFELCNAREEMSLEAMLQESWDMKIIESEAWRQHFELCILDFATWVDDELVGKRVCPDEGWCQTSFGNVSTRAYEPETSYIKFCWWLMSPLSNVSDTNFSRRWKTSTGVDHRLAWRQNCELWTLDMLLWTLDFGLWTSELHLSLIHGFCGRLRIL